MRNQGASSTALKVLLAATLSIILATTVTLVVCSGF